MTYRLDIEPRTADTPIVCVRRDSWWRQCADIVSQPSYAIPLLLTWLVGLTRVAMWTPDDHSFSMVICSSAVIVLFFVAIMVFTIRAYGDYLVLDEPLVRLVERANEHGNDAVDDLVPALYAYYDHPTQENVQALHAFRHHLDAASTM